MPLFSIVSPLIAIAILSPFVGNKTAFEVSFYFLLVPLILTIISIHSYSKAYFILNKMERVIYEQIKKYIKHKKFLVNTLSKEEYNVVFDTPKGLIGISTKFQKGKDIETKIVLSNPKEDSVIDISGHFVNIRNFTNIMVEQFKKVKKIHEDNEETNTMQEKISEDTQEALESFLEKTKNKHNSKKIPLS